MAMESDVPLVIAGMSIGAIGHIAWQRYLRPAVSEVVAG